MNGEEDFSSCDQASAWSNDKDRDLEQFISLADRRTDALYQRMRELPKLDADRNSECPFASRLFGAVKEERERVAFSVDLAQEYFPSIDKWLSQCREETDRIEREREELAQRGARMEFGEALGGQQWLCEHLTDLRERLSALIDRMQAALSQADSLPTPGDEE